jgi:hypothetical protein
MQLHLNLIEVEFSQVRPFLIIHLPYLNVQEERHDAWKAKEKYN